MTLEKNTLYVGGATALVLAALAGFGIARWTAAAPMVEENSPEAPASPPDVVAITAEGIRISQIVVASAQSGALDAAISAPATVEPTSDAEAVITPHAAGTVVRLLKRLGDTVRAGETIALVESREASSIAADRSAAAARLALAQRQLARERYLLGQGVTPRQDMETAQANVAVAQAELGRAQGAGAAARVTGDGRTLAVQSPIAGRVTGVAGRLGSFVQAETELFRVADPRSLQIVANVPPGDAARVRAGDRVEIALSETSVIEGRVRVAVRDVNEQTRQASVVIDLNASGTVLAPGQLVRTRIFASGGASGARVLVPQDAVQTLGDRTVVFVRTANGFRAQAISVGARSAGQVEVLGGLTAGTAIATTNAFLLKAELGKADEE